MAGIPVHTSSPINPNAIDLPQAAPTATAAPTRTENWPATVQANTTAIAANSANSAQPGAGIPTPISTASSQYTPLSSYSPVPTRTIPAPPVGTRQSPPPPQPGQAPSPRSSSRNTRRPSYPVPPQPQAAALAPSSTGDALPPLQTNPAPSNYPLPSARVYEPFRAQPPASTTSTYQQDLSHPPGYQQDHQASFHDRPIEDVENKTHTPSPTWRGMGLLDNNPSYEASGEDNPMWDTAVSWAKAAGKRLSVGEAQIWKAINGDK